MAAPVSANLLGASYWGGVLGVVSAGLVASAGAFWAARLSGWLPGLVTVPVVALTYLAAPLPLLLANEILAQGAANLIPAVLSSFFVALIVAVQILTQDPVPAVLGAGFAAALIWVANQRKLA